MLATAINKLYAESPEFQRFSFSEPKEFMHSLAYHLSNQAKTRKLLSHMGAKCASEDEFIHMSKMGELKGGGSATMVEARTVVSRTDPSNVRLQFRMFKDLGNYNYGRWYQDTYHDCHGLSQEHIADCVEVGLAFKYSSEIAKFEIPGDLKSSTIG